MKILIIFLKASWHSFIIKIPPVAHKFINGLKLSPVSYTELEGRIPIPRQSNKLQCY